MVSKENNSIGEDLEKVQNLEGNKVFWSIKDKILDRKDKVRHTIAISFIIIYLMITFILLFLYFTGKCDTNGIICDSPIYISFTGLVGVVIGFYFSTK